MATAAAAAAKRADIKEFSFSWVGQDRSGKTVRGEMRATGEAQVNATLRRQGIRVVEVKRQRLRGGRITEKDITLFTRQLATMMKSGVPLLQAFDIVGKGHSNPAVAKLLLDIKTEVETGSSLKQAFEKHPLYFDALFCNLVGAGEAAGILDSLLDRLATYKEKILAIKSKIKAALFYPVSIVVVAFVITAIIMIFVIPTFKSVFEGFGADLPGIGYMLNFFNWERKDATHVGTSGRAVDHVGFEVRNLKEFLNTLPAKDIKLTAALTRDRALGDVGEPLAPQPRRDLVSVRRVAGQERVDQDTVAGAFERHDHDVLDKLLPADGSVRITERSISPADTSRPENGSSSTISSGLCISAATTSTFCRMPFEKAASVWY